MSHPVLPIASLSNRHPGLTPAIAAVFLSRHYHKPLTRDRTSHDESIALLREARSSQTRMVGGNAIDTTESSVYACALKVI